MADLTPDDVAEYRADAARWPNDRPREKDRRILALCDALEAAWATTERMGLDWDRDAADMTDRLKKMRERAERAEAARLHAEEQWVAATNRESHLWDISKEQDAALARVRAALLPNEVPPGHPHHCMCCEALRAAIEGDDQ